MMIKIGSVAGMWAERQRLRRLLATAELTPPDREEAARSCDWVDDHISTCVPEFAADLVAMAEFLHELAQAGDLLAPHLLQLGSGLGPWPSMKYDASIKARFGRS